MIDFDEIEIDEIDFDFNFIKIYLKSAIFSQNEVFLVKNR